MSKSLTVKNFITLSCEALEGLSKDDARETYKSIKENKNGIWCEFSAVSNALSLKVELNEQIEELEEEIDDNPDDKQQYISKINTLLSSPLTIKLIHDLEIGFNKTHGTFANISENYDVDIQQLQNYKPIATPIAKKTKESKESKESKQSSKTKKNKKTKKESQKTPKKQKSNIKNNSKANSRKSNKQKSKNGTKKNMKPPRSKSKKRKSMLGGKLSTNESASKYKRNKKKTKNSTKTDKKNKSKNLSPSKAKRSYPKLHRRSSTEEDIRHGKLKKKKNQKAKKNKKNKKTKKKNETKQNQPESPTSPKSPKTPTSPKSPKSPKNQTPPKSSKNADPLSPKIMSPSTSATDMYDDDGDEKTGTSTSTNTISTSVLMFDNTEMQSTDAENESEESGNDEDNQHISTQSQDRGKAWALFEALSSPKSNVNTRSGFGSEPPPTALASKKITKKGKRYTDFKAFSSGAFSIVYSAKDKQNGHKIVAVKKIHIGGNRENKNLEPTTKEEGDNEVRILKLLNAHSNTCNLMDTYFDIKLGMNMGYVLCIVMEYMQFTMKDRMDYYGEKGKCIPFHLIKIYLFQLCKAVSYMHIKNVCHRDIKPENVLININTNRLQICDFGCSIVLSKNEYNNDEKYEYEQNEDGNETYVMSRFYRPPELILGNVLYDCSADIWSLGVVISELFLGTILFMGSSNFDQLREIILKLGWPNKQEICDMNPSITQFDQIDGVYGVDKSTLGESFNMIFMGVMDMEESAVDLISKLLVYSPDERLTATQCLQHEYFDKIHSLMNKSNKKKKNNKKIKKDQVVPNDLFDWNEIETKYAKSNNIILRK